MAGKAEVTRRDFLKTLGRLSLGGIMPISFGCATRKSNSKSLRNTIIPEEAKLREIENLPYYGKKYGLRLTSIGGGVRWSFEPYEELSPDGKTYVCKDKAIDFAEHLEKKGIPNIVVGYETAGGLYRGHAVVEAFVYNPRTGKREWRVYDPTLKNNKEGLLASEAYKRLGVKPWIFLNENHKVLDKKDPRRWFKAESKKGVYGLDKDNPSKVVRNGEKIIKFLQKRRNFEAKRFYRGVMALIK